MRHDMLWAWLGRAIWETQRWPWSTGRSPARRENGQESSRIPGRILRLGGSCPGFLQITSWCLAAGSRCFRAFLPARLRPGSCGLDSWPTGVWEGGSLKPCGWGAGCPRFFQIIGLTGVWEGGVLETLWLWGGLPRVLANYLVVGLRKAGSPKRGRMLACKKQTHFRIWPLHGFLAKGFLEFVECCVSLLFPGVCRMLCFAACRVFPGVREGERAAQGSCK